jgi:hypothetical protein
MASGRVPSDRAVASGSITLGFERPPLVECTSRIGRRRTSGGTTALAGHDAEVIPTFAVPTAVLTWV